ncbi:MAG: diguanylate cyclase [Desulfobacula sp.]|nr:diguanylate cyclase [Desulfobacula sp.]
MSSAQNERLMTLQDQVRKLLSQKDTLLKELDTVEERFEKTNRLYRKYFPVIIDSVAAGDNPFARTCKELGIALKKGASEGKIEYIFGQLKTAMLKEDIGSVSGKKKKGLFSSFMKGSSVPFIDEYKQSYHDVANNLRSNLGEKYFNKLDNITERIKAAEDTDDISEIRESVFNLLFVYISDTSQDREKVNFFVREIVGKILDIESKVATTYEQTDSMFQSNEEFELVLSSEMKGLKQESDVALSLDALKVEIAQRLLSIEFVYKKEKVKVTVSIGVSQSREEDKNHQQIFERSDIAVYKAKEQGRNRVLVC